MCDDHKRGMLVVGVAIGLPCASACTQARRTGTLMPGCAEKLAGRLSWAAQFMFFRVGRAMLRPIFDQRNVGNGMFLFS